MQIVSFESFYQSFGSRFCVKATPASFTITQHRSYNKPDLEIGQTRGLKAPHDLIGYT